MNMLPRRLIKIGFYLLYHQMAWTYDFIAWSISFGQWSAWRRLVMQFLQAGPTLELAYGTGGLLIDLIEAGYRPVGIDLSPYMARLAGRRLSYRDIAMRLSQAKAQSLPFPSNYFANVVATFPTNYMFDPATLAEVSRVLRSHQNGPAGRLIIVVEGQLRAPEPIRFFIDWLYKITGQQNFPDFKPTPIFAAYNLDARWETVAYEGVSARLLIASKEAEVYG